MKRLTETTTVNDPTKASTSGRMRVQAITAGLGSSGYYSPQVIEQAATDELITAGTPLYFDHPSESARVDRPERSVRDIAAVFTTAATYDAATEALVGDIQIMAPYRELLAELGPHIGLSIHGSATDVTEGEHEGKRVPVVEGLAAIDSVDWVTRAGRGGKVLSLLESAGVRPVDEAKVSNTAWSEFSDSDYDDDQYRRACVLDRGGDGAVKERYGLPVREPSGALNRNAVHAAAGMIGKTKGATPEVKKAAAKKLLALYRGDLDEDPPAALLTLAGETSKTEETLRIARESDLSEAMVRDTEAALRDALQDAYAVTTPDNNRDRVYVWVRDFDPTTGVVFFTLDGPGIDGGEQLYSQPFTGTGTTVALDGQRSEVRVVTTYVPATGSGSASTSRSSDTTTKESREDTMEITEAEHTRLQEAAGERDTLRAEKAERGRRDEAVKIIGEAKTPDGKPVTFTALEQRGLLADLPVVESGDNAGQLEVAVFSERVTDAVKVVTEADAVQRRTAGEGTVHGFGSHLQDNAGDLDEAAPTTSPWGRDLTEQKGA